MWLDKLARIPEPGKRKNATPGKRMIKTLENQRMEIFSGSNR